MHSGSETLQSLARQMGADGMSSRAELEAKLVPLLRLILRTGYGHPSLLRWVRHTLPVVTASALQFGDQVDPEWAATKLSRLLCAQLLQAVRLQRETLVNHQTVLAL